MIKLFLNIAKLLLIIIIILSIDAYPQKSIADSLVNQLENISGEKKVDVLNKIADIYSYIDVKTAIKYASEGISLANSIDYKEGIAKNYSTLGLTYTNSDIDKSLDYAQKSLKIREIIGNKEGIASSLNVLGVIYYLKGDYYTSIEYHLNALKLRQEIGNKSKIAASLNNIALVHISIGNYTVAYDYLMKSYSVRLLLNDKYSMGICLNNIGEVYAKMGKYDSAFINYTKALKLYQEAGYKNLIANILDNVAGVYKARKDTANAFKNYFESLKMYTELKIKHGISNAENGLALLYQEYGKSDLAIIHALNSLKNAQDIRSLENVSIASKILQQEYSAKGDYNKAYSYLRIHVNAKDSLISTEKLKKLSKKEYDYRIGQLKKEQESEIEKQKMFIYALALTIILFLVIFILIYFSYRNKKATNKKLNELNNRLQELNSTKDKFFSIIAHDLKSPFMGLMGYSQILSEEYDELEEDERRTYINSLFDLTRSSYKLLENLLEWSRLQTGKMDFNPVEINLHNELSPTIDMLAKTALNKDIEVLNLIDVNVIIKADKYMLEAAIRNLISNSIKFTQTGGEIKVKGRNTEECVEISIQDNGIGMKDDIIQNLFKIDKNISTNGTANEKGTGLGLLLCKEMVDRHNGKIWATSNVGIGSTFFITLPKN